MDQRILHLDMDAFFAAVECARDPALRGKPLIIGGNIDDVRAVVSTASYEARLFGVHSAMPLAEAKRLCPHGIYMRGNDALYQEASRQVRAILETISPLVQMASIDEAYVDITGSQKLFGGDDAIAAHIKERIRGELALPCTIAVAPNKLVAKVAAGEAKPDGYRRLEAGAVRAFLAPLPVRKLPGAGPKTCNGLEALHIRTIGDLAECDPTLLERRLGQQIAQHLRRAAVGIGHSEVHTGRLPKQISRETTFAQDLSDWARVGAVAAYLAERCAYALRDQGLETKTVSIKVRASDFDTHTYAQSLLEPTALDRDIQEALAGLLIKGQAQARRVRLIGVALNNLSFDQHQLALFDRPDAEKWERVTERVDGIRKKLGFDAMVRARTLLEHHSDDVVAQAKTRTAHKHMPVDERA